MPAFVIGLIVGANLALLLVGVCMAAASADRRSEMAADREAIRRRQRARRALHPRSGSSAASWEVRT